jgi:hypothetical protein
MSPLSLPATVGAQLRHLFWHRAAAARSELELFACLRDSLLHVAAPSFSVTIVHGSRYQVWHDVAARLALGSRRCEIADLLIVAFDEHARLPPRATFLQAKYERRHLGPPGTLEAFHADMVQWSLLATRPTIAGAAQFRPPTDLFSAATLDSMGSFGFFHRATAPCVHTTHDCVYAAASSLSVMARTGKKPGRLLTHVRNVARTVRGLDELTCAVDFAAFGTGLAALCVGSPIATGTPLASWLASTLVQRGASPLLRELAAQLRRGERVGVAGDAPFVAGGSPLPDVVVVRTGTAAPRIGELLDVSQATEPRIQVDG